MIVEELALTTLSYVIVRMLQRFDVLEPHSPEPHLIKHHFRVANIIVGGVRVRLHAAEEV